MLFAIKQNFLTPPACYTKLKKLLHTIPLKKNKLIFTNNLMCPRSSAWIERRPSIFG